MTYREITWSNFSLSPSGPCFTTQGATTNPTTDSPNTPGLDLGALEDSVQKFFEQGIA